MTCWNISHVTGLHRQEAAMNKKPLTPGRAVRRFCLECCGGAADVKNCGGDALLTGEPCPLFHYRAGRGRPSVKVIRRECLHCMCGSRNMVENCGNANCFLFLFRMGINPNHQISKNQAQKRQFNGQFCSQKERITSGNGVMA